MRGSEFAELKAFAAVVERASFARAAEQLGLSPSAYADFVQATLNGGLHALPLSIVECNREQQGYRERTAADRVAGNNCSCSCTDHRDCIIVT
jgi:hypothetical protein